LQAILSSSPFLAKQDVPLFLISDRLHDASCGVAEHVTPGRDTDSNALSLPTSLPRPKVPVDKLFLSNALFAQSDTS